MSGTRHKTPSAVAAKHKRDRPSQSDPYLEISAAARTRSSHHAFFTDSLRIIARAMASPYATLYVSRGAEVIEDDWHTGPTNPAFWKSAVQRFLTESLERSTSRAKLFNPKRGGTKAAFLSSPLFDSSGAVIGRIALVDTPTDESAMPQRLAVLESLTSLASSVAMLVGEQRGTKSAFSPEGLRSSGLSELGEVQSPEQLAFSITNNLRNKIGCEQVALGQVRGRSVKILSISGLDEVASRTPGIAPLQGAMEECLDAGTPIACQQEELSDQELAGGFRMHKQWRSAASGDAVASIPLQAGLGTVAVLSLRQNRDAPFTREQIQKIRKLVEPFAPLLVLTQKATRGLLRHGVDAVRHGLKVMTGGGCYKTKATVAVLTIAAAWFLFGTIDYHVTTPCVVAPAEVRHITMPFDGVLASVEVVPGDRIRKGDLLCGVKADELTERRDELQAELATIEPELNNALAENDPVTAQLCRAKQRLLRTQLAILNGQIRRAQIRSPIDGVVAKGDLRKRVGSVIAKGEPLLEVAPLNEILVELRTPEGEVDDLREGQAGTFAPAARPEEHCDFDVERIRPAAEIHDGKNVFVAEARAEVSEDWIRPGMEGVAKVNVGPRPVWWIVLHRMIDYIRLKLWL